ncbi:AraC family transcriptional regulator [Neobacillus sp.]|uniref:helix-turn-helix transcriptional regulator n=1 Tax=Neobacillus sp. TaxID=2675273 RepID=UPI00289E8BBE|nr:AraC family transcriptional regulator [Neobacillus sp.]
MLDYIHNNFSDNLTLANIAKVADIGERECLRCFQRTIQRSPIQYLLKYRIMQGADFLLKYPATSISEISSFCGLDSPSNFSKMFKRFYNCTPREYRNLHMMK